MGDHVGGGQDGGRLGGVAVLVEGLGGPETEPGDGREQQDGDDRAGAGHGQASTVAQAGSWPRCLRTAALCISPAW